MTKPSKSLKIFHSFEEMNDYDIEQMAKQTPEESLRTVTRLLQHIYAEEIKKWKRPTKIHFK